VKDCSRTRLLASKNDNREGTPHSSCFYSPLHGRLVYHAHYQWYTIAVSSNYMLVKKKVLNDHVVGADDYVA
jgi:hypothetical protein